MQDMLSVQDIPFSLHVKLTTADGQIKRRNLPFHTKKEELKTTVSRRYPLKTTKAQCVVKIH